MLDKTLIILDTNQAWNTGYVGFELGGEYIRIKQFIIENGLGNQVHIAISKYVLEEVKEQKIGGYKKDVSRHKETTRKLASLGVIQVHDVDDVNIEELLDVQMAEFLAKESLTVLNLADEDRGKVLETIALRAIKKKPPFKVSGKHSDSGFKDVLIWETIMNSNAEISTHENVFLCSNDEGFSGCKKEFEDIYNKNFDIFTSVDFLLEKLKSIYSDVIDNKEVFSYANSEYFSEQVVGFIKDARVWPDFDGNERNIVEVRMMEKCVSLEKNEEADDEGIWHVSYRITSHLEAFLEGSNTGAEDEYPRVDVEIITTVNDTNEVIDFEVA